MPRRGEPVDTEGRLRETIGRYHGVVLDTNAFAALIKAFVDDICETPADNVVYAFFLEVKRMMGENFLLYSYEELRAEYAKRLEDLRNYDGQEVCYACPILSELLGPTVRGLCYLFKGHEDVSVHDDVLSRPEYSEQLERLYRGLRRGGTPGYPSPCGVSSATSRRVRSVTSTWTWRTSWWQPSRGPSS